VRRLLAVQPRVAIDVVDADRRAERPPAVAAHGGEDVGRPARLSTTPRDGDELAVSGDGRRRIAAARDAQLGRTSRPGQRDEPDEAADTQDRQADGRRT
jgi:hypothetical protein